MRPSARFAVVVVATVLTSNYLRADGAEAESKTYASTPLGQRIAAFAQRAESLGFTGVILAAKDGQVVAAVGVGSADLDGKTPNTPATLFEIASATKPFTAMAVMRLAQDKKLSLDDPIAKHLPGVPDDCKAITVRHLLQHTSGISGDNSQGGGDDLAAVLPSFLRGGPKHPPGEHWEYWNQGYSLASEVIARASGTRYTEYLQAELLTPAGMTASRFTGDKAPDGFTVAVGRSSYGPPRSALEHPYRSYGFQYRGMGGLVTSVWDLWRWDRALHDTKLLTAESKAELYKPGPGDYGLGWFVRKNQQGRLVQSHGGSVRGFVCDVRRYPYQNACLFVLSNRDDAPVPQVADAVEALLFGETSKLKDPPKPLTDELSKALAGKYADAKGAKLSVEADGKATRLRIHWYANGPVTRAVLGLDDRGDVVLYEWTSATKLKFERDGDGPVKQIPLGDRVFVRE